MRSEGGKGWQDGAHVAYGRQEWGRLPHTCLRAHAAKRLQWSSRLACLRFVDIVREGDQGDAEVSTIGLIIITLHHVISRMNRV